MMKPEESALWLSDCTDICVSVEAADNSLHCYWTAEAGHFSDISHNLNLFPQA